MSDPNYDYSGIIAEYWDLLRGDTSQWSSRPYFLKIIQEGGQPALDVACGTGRLLLDYMAEGIEIDGVDISADMITVCREKAERAGLEPNLYVQAMQQLDLPRLYRTIIVPSSSFLHLTDIDDARKALLRFYVHLMPGGLLAMSMKIFEPDPSAEEWEMVEEATRPSDGVTIRRWFRCSYDVPNRLQHTEDRYETIKNGKVVQTETFSASPFLTWYTTSQASDLLEEAGFVDVQAHSDFTFEPATDEDTSFIVLARRPEMFQQYE